MSTTTVPTPQDKILNEDNSIISTSTTISVTESITQEISKIKNPYLIPKNIVQRIPEILSFLQSNNNTANNKIPILKYLQSLFLSVDFNSEIFLRKFIINEKEKLNLYKVIINQYIFYSNNNNSKADEENYRGDLQNLFLLLLSQMTLDKEIYHYILSPLINFINEKNILNLNKKNLSGSNNSIENDPGINFNFKSEHLQRVLVLLKYFYGYYKNGQSLSGIMNYFFFSGDSDSSIVVRNRDNPQENNKKILNFDETLCIMMFIKVLPSEYIKTIHQIMRYKLLEINFVDKKQSVQINMNIDNVIYIPPNEEPINPKLKLKENETNCILFKFNYTKKKSLINCQIMIGSEKFDLPPISISDTEKEKNSKTKDEIKEIVFFKNFIGTCSNIIIYKEKKNEGLPKFLFSNNENKQRMSLKGDNSDNNKSSHICLFPNGIYNEELYSSFTNAELIEQQENISQKINIINSDQNINYNIFRDFLANNLISIYIPTRYVIPNQTEEKTIQNASQIILVDSINNLNAEFKTRTPALNGLHIFQNLYENDLGILGGINNLLPIMEIMMDNYELLNSENFSSFFNLLTVYVLSPKYENALREDKSNFFKCMSYFLEKIPEKYFNDELVEDFRTILGFLCPPNNNGEEKNYLELKNQFFNYILTNEKILLKFNEENQKKIIGQITTTVERSNLDADIIKIIRIMLTYDRNRNYKFCCRNHSQYFNENYSIMDPELSNRLQPIERLLEVVFDKKYKSTMKIFEENFGVNNKNKNAKKTSNKNVQKIEDLNKFEDNNLYYLFYLLTYNISPCMQKSIISLINNFLKEKEKYKNFFDIFDKKKELFDIILFVFKTSIFDIKFQIFNLLLLMDKNNKWEHLKKKDIKIFVQNELLPVFLLDEVNTLPVIKEKEEKNEIKIEEKKEGENNEEEVKKNIEEKNSIKFGIRPEIEIDEKKYLLFSSTEMEKKTYNKYNQKQLNYVMKNLYNNAIVFFYDDDIIFNFVVKIAFSGDLSLIDDFLSKIRGIIESPDSQKNLLYKKIINNHYFLQFILDSYLQLYILNDNKDPNKKFIPSFSLDLYKKPNTLEEKEIPLDETEKKDKIKKALNNCEKILLYILSENITNFDYVLTWGKYYEKIKEENNIYNYIYEIIDKLLLEIISGQNKAVVTLSGKMSLKDPQIQSTLYYLNICLEFITFFKLEYDNNFFLLDKDKFKILEGDLRYILFKQESKKIKNLSPIQELENNDNKINNFSFLTIIMSTLYPIWLGEEKKVLGDEKNLYNKLTMGSINKNLFVNELEFLLYTFEKEFFKKNEKNICNRGIKMITLLYLFFTCLLNIGGEQRFIIDNFRHFRLFLSVLIVSPPTINLSEAIKKKKWPDESQFKEVNTSVHCILFNYIFFIYNKLQNLKNQENEFNSKTEDEKESDKKTLECILVLKKIYMENLGYILKILNKIYRGVKEDENQNKGWNIFKGRNKIFEKIKKTGAFSLINELYNECFITIPEKANTDLTKKKNKEKEKEKEKDITRKYTDQPDLNENNKEILDLNLKNFKSEEVPKIPQENIINENSEEKINLSASVNINEEKTKEEILLSNDKNNNNNINNCEENYLDDIEKINFIQENGNSINLTEEDFQKLEKNINLFLTDEKIRTYYEKHFDQNIENLYAFIPTIKKRQEKLKEIIPVFDNRKNINNFPYDICIVPFYYPENTYKQELMKKIENISKNLKEEIKLCTRILDRDEISKEEEYRNYKKKMFKFRGIWSYEDFFYDNKKYKLKYKLLNHYTNDFTKIFMTPITDIDYYLPKFSKFRGDIFRSELNEGTMVPITKVAEICFSKNKGKIDINNNNNNNLEPQKKQITQENVNNISMISFDSSNYSSLSLLNDTKDNANMQINPLYELNQEYYSFLKEQELKEIKETENLNNNFNPKEFDLFTKFIKKNHLENKGQTLQCEACLVKLSFHIRGIIYINNNEVGFYSYETKRTDDDEDYDLDKKVCFGSIFLESSEKYNNYYIRIPFDQIELILKRRYYFKKNVLEFFIQNKKSYFFRIDEKKFDEFYNAIILNNKKLRDFDEITIESAKSEEKIGLVNRSNLLYDYNNYQSLFFSKRFSTTKNLYIKWTKWEISTFSLLNYINIFASRSYHDINQYPVFPWIITDYTNEEIPDLSLDSNPELTNASDYVPKIRPFGTPMGMLGLNDSSKDRRDNYLINFESPDEKNPDENYDRYGSHYSTGLNLTYYLVRVFPFSYIRIEMQGKNFDDPNRLFNCLETSFENAISQKSDLRELIPEFFCFPEMFYNMNDLNFGEIYDSKLKKNVPVNDILMPLWSNNNAYTFVRLHREMLESVEVSEKIHEWFNIIFGSKQKGKNAKKIHNLFIDQTYDDFDEKHKTSLESDKIYQKRMVEFGVTPSQVFKSDVDKRMQIKNLRKKPIMFEFMTKKEKKEKKEHIFTLEEENEIKIRESELYIEGEPYKMFSSWKIDEEHKHEKMLFLYSDKVRIISRTEKGFFKKVKTKPQSLSTKEVTKTKEIKDNKENKEIIKQEEKEKTEKENSENNNDIKDEKEKEKEKEEKNEIKENSSNSNSNINEENTVEEKDNKNSNDVSIEEETEIKDEEINDIASNKGVSKYDRILISPKYRMDISQSPAIIYDKGNYIALGGFWSGQIIINKLEEQEKSKKNKNLKNINLINTRVLSPITNMKIDESETFILCTNKLGCVFIFEINKSNKLLWNLYKKIQDNQKEITSIDLNENLNIFATTDKEGFINLYTFPQCKLFNSYKLNENQFPVYNNPTENNSSSVSRSESNINLSLTQNDIYADLVIISHNPLPCFIFYIRSKKCLCVFSINFHFINAKYGIELVPNGIKKYSDYFRKDYLFIYNKNNKTIDIYDIFNLQIISRSSKFDYTFVDFYFSKGMELALIMVKIEEDENKNEHSKDKNMKKNYKILMLNTQVKTNEKNG